jgi:outer membrane receptor protein involved in Fe transport
MFRQNPLSVAVQRALSGVALAAAAGATTGAYAQDAAEEIIVTGSRIAADPNLITSSPVTQVRSEEMELRGITRVEDLLNDLPQIVPEFTSNESNGATGTATLDLRGLASERTLVMTNGHRMGFGDVFELAPDVNQVPGTLIERVEVLTGGASSTYGSDAVAGVVNFIMRRDFEGVQIDYQYSAYQHNSGNEDVQDAIDARGFEQAPDDVWDGGTHDVNLIVGVNTPDGRGNITAYLGYRDINAIRQSERDFSACALSTSNGVTCGGSATSATGLFSDFYVSNFTFAGANAEYTFPGPGLYYTVEGDQFTPGVPLYNYGPLNYFQRPDERYTAGLFGHYEINEHADVYTEFQFMDDRSLAQIAPSGAFFVTSEINCNNPFLSAQQFATVCANDRVPDVTAGSAVYDDPDTAADAVADFTAARAAEGFTPVEITNMINASLGAQTCTNGAIDPCPLYIGRRNVEGGPRFDDLRHTSYRLLGGVRGKINEDWSYDAFANFSRLVFNETYNNDMSTTRIIRALDVVPGPGGAPTCQSVIDGTDPSCVPWNIFEEGGVTQEAIDYLTLPLFSKAEMTQYQYVGFVTGDLTDMGVVSPYASDGVTIVLGGEYRDEQMDFDVDQGFQSGDGAGQGGPVTPVEGQVQVAEFFTELKIPVVQDRPWFESLTAEFGYRYSDYDTGVDTNTYKAGGEWTPVEGFKFRGGYSRAVRHANLRELFEPASLGLWSEGGDPCAGPDPELTQAQCALTGVSAAQYGLVPLSPAGQYNGFFGGNPNLDPEKSNSWTIGAVFTPDEYVPGLQFSVDYWSIELNGAIDDVEPSTIINQCALTGDPALCDLIIRGPNGNLWIGSDANAPRVISTNVNIGFLDLSGIDFTGTYTHEIGDYGSLGFNFRGTWIDKWDQQEIPGGDIQDCTGLWGGACSRPTPEWKHMLSATWTTPWNVVATGTYRFVGGTDELSTAADAFDTSDEHYLDLAVTYTPTFVEFGESTITIGVSNVTDNDPPVNGRLSNVAVFGNGNTIPGTWDALGRYFFFNFSQKF